MDKIKSVFIENRWRVAVIQKNYVSQLDKNVVYLRRFENILRKMKVIQKDNHFIIGHVIYENRTNPT